MVRNCLGDFTAEPDPPDGEQRNGFVALAEFDKAEKGGNQDGIISASDSIFASLSATLAGYKS